MPDAEDLPVERRSIDTLIPDPDNARRHNRRNLETIMESLHQFGQRKPIVITADSVIRAGNGTLEAMLQMREEADSNRRWRQFDEVWVTVFPGTADEARAYAIADNRTSDLSEWDHRLLLKQLQTMQDDDAALLRAAGFESTEMDELVRRVELADLANLDAAAAWAAAGMPEYADENKEGAFSTTVHFATDEDADRFFATLNRPRAAWFWWPQSDGFKGILRNVETRSTREEPVG